jgi:hypothetical protein
MKSVCFLMVVILSRASAAGPLDVEALTPQSSIESKCRSAVRAELKGPKCRQVYVWANRARDPSSCAIEDHEQPFFIDKVIQCVARGGPGRAAR